MHQTVRIGRLADGELHAALADARIQTLYQPIVRMSDRRPVGLEVLARLHHPLLGTLEPDHFVPGMELAGLGRPLFEAVIRSAFADWHDAGLAEFGLTLAVNLPLDVLLLPETPDWLDAARAASGIAARSIVIELTESQEIACLATLTRAAAVLHDRGYVLAIDDVGPDVRDHSTLLDLPFTVLKLDRSLVQATQNDGAALDFFTTTLEAARRAGMIVIAEGVEDDSTWTSMAEHGIDLAQGYIVSRPLPATAVGPWLADWRRGTAA
jgi:EAL domain-containing protein (putative c-di-GMP-specific phosphodiesterase class I)